MRIALLNSTYPPVGIGGAEQSTRLLATELVKLGHAVKVITENVLDERDVEDVDGVEVVRLASPPGHGPNVREEPYLTRALLKQTGKHPPPLRDRVMEELSGFGPHVVHTASFGQLPAIWEAASDAGWAVVHTLRNYVLLCHRRMMRQSGPCLRQCADCRATRLEKRPAGDRLDAVVGVGRHVLKVHIEAGWFTDVATRRVIPNGYAADERTDAATLAEADHDFGFIGRLHPTKGVEELLQAVEALRGGDRRIRVLVAGSGNPEYEAMLASRYAHDDTTFAGYMDRNAFFPRIRYCVIPSTWYEPFGRVFVEAFHHGVPVVGSRRGGGAEIVSDGVDGFLVDPSTAALGAALDRALSTPAAVEAEMRAAASRTARRYTGDAVARAYADLYREALFG